MREKKVSVIVAAYNAEKYIVDCIDSIKKQTYVNWDIWICDDCSNDETLNIIMKMSEIDSRIHIMHNDTNIFAGASRNRCIQACDGDYIVIQDADDISEPNRFELLVSELESSGYDFVSSGHYLFDSNGIYQKVTPRYPYPEKKDFLRGMPFCHAATMFRRECLLDVNGYRVSAETRRGQDYDMFMRLYARGYKGKNISSLLYGYRVDRETIARRKFRYRIDECKIRYKGFKLLGLLPMGLVYVLKPIPAHILQIIKTRK